MPVWIDQSPSDRNSAKKVLAHIKFLSECLMSS